MESMKDTKPTSSSSCGGEGSLLDPRGRVKFTVTYEGELHELLDKEYPEVDLDAVCEKLSDALWHLELAGVTPVMPDGRVGGNCALLIHDGYGSESGNEPSPVMLVTKSGKMAGCEHLDPERDFCLVDLFNEKEWAASYWGCSPDVIPTSDAPMHYTVFKAHDLFGWTEQPNFILHGHALATDEEAEALGLPISDEETLCSTPEDTAALWELMKKHPYPQTKIYLRKGHGFLLVAKTIEEAMEIFNEKIKTHIKLPHTQ